MTARPPSVLFVGAFPAPAPVERYVSGDLAMRLESRGWCTRLVSRKAGRLGRCADIPLSIWRWRAEYGLACVDIYSGPAFLWAEAACAVLRRLGKPYVLTLHGGDLPEFGKRHATRVKKLLASAAAVTCPSAYLATEMRRFRPDILLIPNGLDLPQYPFGEPRPPLRELVWIRAFHEVYNPTLAVQVLAAVCRQSEVRLSMIGPDKGDGSLGAARQTAAELGVAALVTFPGPVPKDQVPKALENADIFLNTTNFDNTPVSVLEAMACGLPVVSTNVGGIPYLLTHNETALLSAPGDAAAMTKAVLQLMRHQDLAANLSRNARRQVEPFDWAAVLPQWERLLASLVSRNHSSSRNGAVAASRAKRKSIRL